MRIGKVNWPSSWKNLPVFVSIKYIGVAKACCDMLAIREKIPAHKLKVVHNGISLDIPEDVQTRADDIKQKYKYPEGAFIIGSVGRLHPVKGHEYLIDAAGYWIYTFESMSSIFPSFSNIKPLTNKEQ